VSEIALELDGVLATGLDTTAVDPADADTARAAFHADQLAAEVEELAARLGAGEDREATRVLMSRIGNRMVRLAGMSSQVAAMLSPGEAAAAGELWSDLRAYYRGRRSRAVEVTE
jgi:hypothetical protein